MTQETSTYERAGPVDWKGTTRFEVVRRIGEGGMGVVYEVADRERGQRLAAKTLLHFSADALYRFKQEFRVLTDVRHRNLVRLHELVVDESDQAFFVMELVRGTDFVTYVQQAGSKVSDRPMAIEVTACRACGSVPPRSETMQVARPKPVPVASEDFDKLRRALRQLVEGLQALHGSGKLHRDVKPSNVLVTPDGRVVVLDFGVATELARVGGHTEAEGIVGTARYMAPEQAMGEELTPASDWYSVGVMLYEALVGGPPFVGEVSAVLTMKATADPVAPSERVQGIPDDLESLCLALLSRDPASRPTGSEILQRLGAPRSPHPGPSPRLIGTIGTPTLIGREQQLRALRDAFTATREGRSVTVRVGGGSGMGKSAVVQHFVDELLAAGEAFVLRGRAYERESVPYKALDSVVDALSRYLIRMQDDGDPVPPPTDFGALARIFPVLRRVPGMSDLAEGTIGSPQRLRQRAFLALRELLQMASRRQPLVLYVDDAQWGDADSAALLLELVRPPDAPPLLIILTYRDNEAQASPFLIETSARWPEHAEVREVAVGPLDMEESRRLALALLGPNDHSLLQRTANAVARESGGSPFLVEELVRSASAHLFDRSALDPTLPAVTLDQMVSERLEALPDGARRLLEIVAVGGRPLTVAMGCDAASIHEGADEAVALLAARRFLHAGLRGGHEVIETIHDRIRETIAGQLSPATVRAHHGSLARALGATPDADPEALALHLIGAGERERAGQHAERAAERAGAKLAFDQAARLLRLALETTPASSKDARRLRTRLAEVLEWAGLGAEAARVYLEAAEGASTLQRAELERAAAEQLLTCGRIDEGAAVLHRVLVTAGLRAPRSPLGAILWLIVYRIWASVIGLGFKEREADEVSRVDRLRLDALYAAALGFAIVDVVLGACIQTRYLVMALRAGDRLHVLRAALMLATQHANMGGPEGKRERALRALVQRLADQSDSSEVHAFFHGTRGIGLFLRGRWKEALNVLDTAYAKYPTNRAGWQSNANLFAVYALLYIGDVKELALRQARLLREAEQRGDLYTAVNLRVSPPKVLSLAADDPQEARRQVRAGMSQWSQRGYLVQHWQAMRTEAEIEIYVGDAKRAYERVQRDARALEESFLLKGQFTRVLTAEIRGRCAIALLGSRELEPSERAARLAEARRMARQLDREKMPYAALYAAILKAGIASVTGDRARTLECLRVAIRLAEETSMVLHTSAARYRLGSLLGGDEGRQLVREAHDAMTDQGVRAPARFTAMLVPLGGSSSP